MLEVIIAMALLAIMLIAVSHVLAHEQRLSVHYAQRLQAWQALTELVRRWQINSGESASYRAAVSAVTWQASPTVWPCSESSCDNRERALADVVWAAQQLQDFPKRLWVVRPCTDIHGDCLWFSWFAPEACEPHRIRWAYCLWVVLPP